MIDADFNPFKLRKNLSEVLVKCVTIESPFDVIVSNLSREMVEFKEGTMASVFMHLQQTLGFRYECKRGLDGVFGSYNVRTKSWNGMVRILVDNEADIIVAPVSIQPDRAAVIDYLIPIVRDRGVLLYKKPKGNEDITFQICSSEFSNYVWLASAIFLISLTGIIMIFTRFAEEREISLSDAAMLVTGAICNMGFECDIRSYSARVLVITVYLSTFLLYSFYTSMLTASLTVNHEKYPITNFEELYENRDKYRLLVFKGSSYFEALRASTDPLYINIYNSMIAPYQDSLPDYEESIVIKLFVDCKIVVLLGLYGVEQFPFCDLLQFPTSDRTPMTLGVRKLYYLQQIFNYHIRNFLENGSFQREKLQFEKQQNWRNKPACSHTLMKSIAIQDVYFVLLLYASGIMASFLLCLLEILVFRIENASIT